MCYIVHYSLLVSPRTNNLERALRGTPDPLPGSGEGDPVDRGWVGGCRMAVGGLTGVASHCVHVTGVALLVP